MDLLGRAAAVEPPRRCFPHWHARFAPIIYPRGPKVITLTGASLFAPAFAWRTFMGE